MENEVSERSRWTAVLLMTLAALLPGCGEQRARERAARLTGGDPGRGPDLIRKYGCSACHAIPGIEGTHGTIGPPLHGIGSRSHLAGRLPNTPENLMRWIEDPQSIARGTAMPDAGMSHAEAQDIAAYLYTLR